MLHTFHRSGDCCDAPLARAIMENALDAATVWTCPECGCDWRAEMQGPVKHWRPYPVVAVFV